MFPASLFGHEIYAFRNTSCLHTQYSFSCSRRTLWLDKNTRRKSRVFYYSCEYKIAARKCNLAFQGVRIILPFVSTPHISTMVQIAMTIQQKEAKIQELKNLMSVFRIEDHLKNTQILKKIQSG